MVDKQDLALVHDSAHLSEVMPLLEDTVRKTNTRIEADVFRLLRDGILTGEGAIQAWMSIKSNKDMLKGLATRVRMGQAVGVRVADEMEIQ